MQPNTPGTDLATISAAGMATGLEDFDVSDLKLPRLNINHKEGTLQDSQSNMQYPEVDFIGLGVIKQRVLWQPTVSEDPNVQPLCKSTNNQQGYPTTHLPQPNLNFPWGAALWNPNDFPKNEEGRIVLPCQSCRLKDWGSHPIDNKKTWCTEQHAIPLLYAPVGQEPGMTALFTAQRSSINASKAFFGSAMRRNLPAFAVRGRITLRAQQRGTNTYYVPTFVETGLTAQDDWATYAEALLGIREFITQPPRIRDDQNAVNPQQLGQQNTIQGQYVQQPMNYAPPAQQPAQQQYMPPPQAPVSADPWPVQGQYQPPAQQQYVPQMPPPPPPPPASQYMPPPPAPPMPPPVAQAQVVPPTAPAQPQAAPPVQNTPTQVSTPLPMGATPARDGASNSDDELPF